MENSIEIQSENIEEIGAAKKAWVRPAMRTLNTVINGEGTGTSEAATGVPLS